MLLDPPARRLPPSSVRTRTPRDKPLGGGVQTAKCSLPPPQNPGPGLARERAGALQARRRAATIKVYGRVASERDLAATMVQLIIEESCEKLNDLVIEDLVALRTKKPVGVSMSCPDSTNDIGFRIMRTGQ
jgi:hypothetical protein